MLCQFLCQNKHKYLHITKSEQLRKKRILREVPEFGAALSFEEGVILGVRVATSVAHPNIIASIEQHVR
jgi:hypothetical protein